MKNLNFYAVKMSQPPDVDSHVNLNEMLGVQDGNSSL